MYGSFINGLRAYEQSGTTSFIYKLLDGRIYERETEGRGVFMSKYNHTKRE